MSQPPQPPLGQQQPPQWGQYSAPQQPAPKKRKKWPWILAAIVAFFVVVGHAAMWVVLVTALVSAADYFRRFSLQPPRVTDIALVRDQRSGRRAGLVMLESAPSERKAYVIQEQISRTGVLMGRSFKTDDASFVNPVVALAVGVWLGGERLNGWVFVALPLIGAALALILYGVPLLAWLRRQRPARAATSG